MRLLPVALLAVIVLLQNPLWFGKGGWLRVMELEGQVNAQKDANEQARRRNAALEAEVRDLKQGYDAIEERARAEHLMIRRDEVFFQVVESPPRLSAAAPAPAAAPHP